MAMLTMLVAVAAIALICATRPRTGLGIYLAVLLLYPDLFRIYGVIEISAARIVVMVLLIRCLADPSLVRQFRWQRLDTLVVVAMLVFAAAMMVTTDAGTVLKNRSGFAVESLGAYMVVRLVLTDLAAFLGTLKWFAAIMVPAAISCLYESWSGWNIYIEIINRTGAFVGRWDSEHEMRQGFYRATGALNDPILLGLTFATIFGLIWALRHDASLPRWRWYAVIGLTLGGVLGSLSSGAYVALGVILVCLAFEKVKYLVRPALAVLAVGCLSVEIVSNRHFYDVLSDFVAFDSGNAWYRSQLMRVAWMKLPEYWLAGYGLADPGWGPLIDGLKKTDGVNEFVVHAVVYGVFGLAAYALVVVTAVRSVVRAHNLARSAMTRTCAWALGSSLIGVLVACWTVSLFRQMQTLGYILFAMCVALELIARKEAAMGGRRRPRRAAAAAPARPLRPGPVVVRGPVLVHPWPAAVRNP